MSGSVGRPLPAHPDLESEKKRAKQLLRQARRGELEAISRVGAQNRSLAGASPETIKLADAQVTIAREYGFRSWPLLTRYFDAFARQQLSTMHRNRGEGVERRESWARTLRAEHRDKRFWAAAMIGTFLPRLYGASIDEVFADEISEDEARLVVAREYGFGTWGELIAVEQLEVPDQWREAESPMRRAGDALRAGDVARLQELVARYPELRTAESGRAHASFLGSNAAMLYRRDESPNGKAILAWLASIGIDVQVALNQQLLGFLGGGMTVEWVERTIEAGADPSWIAPNGYTVLEHAIQRYWNGEAVDAIARRVEPRDTLFVACGLGDADAARRFFDRRGRLTSEAMRDRPDISALSGMPCPGLPDPEHALLLWDYAFVAAVNARPRTFDLLLDKGFPIDFCPGMTLLGFAVGNGLLPMVELLISRGASPDVRGWRPNQTPREMCAGYLGRRLDDPDTRRIVELLGADPDVLAREVVARRGPPQPIPGLIRILTFAQQDAIRRGQRAVGYENFLAGLLASNWSGMELTRFADAGVDLHRLRDRFADRLVVESPTHGVMLPFDADLQAGLEMATAIAEKKWDGIWSHPVLVHGLDLEPINGIIRELGGDVQQIKDAIRRIYT